MATTVQEPRVRQGPPDVRGPTAPLPASAFALGIASLALVFGGTVGVQIASAVSGGPLTATCRAEGLTPFNPKSISNSGVKGAEGVCHIVSGLRGRPETGVLVLGIVLGVVAVALGFGAYRRMDTKRRREECIAGAVLGIQAIVLAGFILWFRNSATLVTFTRNFFNFAILKGSLGGFLNGAKYTLLLAFGGELGGIVLGLVLALFALSERRVVRAPARMYINFFRGTPLIWQLSFFYFLGILGFGLKFLGFGSIGFHWSAFTAALLVFSLNTGAYAAEVFRAGIQSIERGQMEAARGLGLSYLQAMRYAIVPQGVRRVIPPLMNEFVILIKDTALVVVLGLSIDQLDLYSFARQGYSDSFNATFFVAAALGYLAITLPLIRLVNWAEKRLRSGMVGVAGAGS
jgi:His/Glu/Gln/Arg/opine family amino acid ABC transporter permease subunit